MARILLLSRYADCSSCAHRRRAPSSTSTVSNRSRRHYRAACDPENPDGVFDHYLAAGRPGSGEFDHAVWHSVLIHFGPLRLVDEVYDICRLKPDPIEACREIARRFMREDLPPVDRPILAQFERTKARWAAEH